MSVKQTVQSFKGFFLFLFMCFTGLLVVGCGGGSSSENPVQSVSQTTTEPNTELNKDALLKIDPGVSRMAFIVSKEVRKGKGKNAVPDPVQYGNVYFQVDKIRSEINPSTNEGEIEYTFVYIEGLETGPPYTGYQGNITFYYGWQSVDGAYQWVELRSRVTNLSLWNNPSFFSGSISGVVKNKVTGQPMSGITVYAVSPATQTSTEKITKSVTSASDGTFTIPNVMPGDYKVYGKLVDFQTSASESSYTVNENVIAGAIVEMLPIMEKNGQGVSAVGKISGVVLLLDNTPVPGAVVSVKDATGISTVFAVKTDIDGQYVLDNVPAGTGYTVFATIDNVGIGDDKTGADNDWVVQQENITVTTGVTTSVNFQINNYPPVIINLTASPSTTVSPGTAVTLTATASDTVVPNQHPPYEDILYYTWRVFPDAPLSFDPPSVTNMATWKAPQTAGTYTLEVIVRDLKGGKARRSLDIVVSGAPPLPGTGNFLISLMDVSDFLRGKLFEMDRNQNVLWEYVVNFPASAQRLSNGNTLISEYRRDLTSICSGGRVIEVTPAKNIVWEYGPVGCAADAERLQNGNTLITIQSSTSDGNPANGKVIEVDVNKNIVWEMTGLGWPRDADRLSNGNTLISVHGDWDGNGGKVIEVDVTKNIVWEYLENNIAASDRLANGDTLIAFIHRLGGATYKIIEIDSNKNIVWQYNGVNADDVHRLSNGNTLIADTNPNRRVIEVTPSGSIVWSYQNSSFWIIAATLIE